MALPEETQDNVPLKVVLDDLPDAFNSPVGEIAYQLRESTEALKCIDESMKTLTSLISQQNSQLIAIASAILIDPNIGSSPEALRYRAELIQKVF